LILDRDKRWNITADISRYIIIVKRERERERERKRERERERKGERINFLFLAAEVHFITAG